MQPYQPFLIAPFRTGLDSDLEPWLLPIDAFQSIENGHIHHGYIEKRGGYRFLAQMVHGEAISAATNANPAVFTVTSTSLTVGESVSLFYLSGGTWANLNAQTYTIASKPTASTFTLTDSSGTPIDGTSLGAYSANSGRVGTFPSDRIMGIFNYITTATIGVDSERSTLAGDTQRIALYNSSSNLFQPLDKYDSSSTLHTNSDAFSGSSTNFYSTVSWHPTGGRNYLFITNGKDYQSGNKTDGIAYYDDQFTRINQIQPTISASALRYLFGCKKIFSIRQRLVCLFTYEQLNGTTFPYPQRARWSAPQAPFNWVDTSAGGGGYIDAPTGDQIVSAQQLQDVIIVFFTQSVWALRPVPDPALPFRWEKINDFRACDGVDASVGYDRFSIALGRRGITATDGVDTKRIDQRIEDFVTNDVNSNHFDKVYVERDYSNTRTWFLYPSGVSEENNAALIFDDDSGAFSKYLINLNVLGYGNTAKDFAAEDFIEANDLDKSAEQMEDDETASSFFWSEEAELFLGGDTSGKVYILDNFNTDNGNSFQFSLQSAGWNPYKEQGIEAQFGYIDLYIDSDQYTQIVLNFYKDNEFEPYSSQTMNLLPDLNFRADVGNCIIKADPTTGFEVYAPSHGLSEGNEFFIYGINGATWLNNEPWVVGSNVNEDYFDVNMDITSYGNVIGGITQANPAVVTSTAHNLTNGDIIYITDVSGMVQVNNKTFTVANVTTNTFELSGIDSTAYTAYTTGGYAHLKYLSGGQVTRKKFDRRKVWKRAYAGGVGYLHSVKISGIGGDRPLKIHAFKPWFRPRGKRTLG
ncbi:MAG: ubiquitin-activating E1 FCCH domain-containing protein [Nitrosopumilaceae archaeon]|nr:ubiquitin-activating E1 FCCH domain-containing protein [Nitrosopumilaceae archaeon]